MKKLFLKYPLILGALLIGLLFLTGLVTATTAVTLVCSLKLLSLVMAKQQGCLFILSAEQELAEMKSVINEIKGGWERMKKLPDEVVTLTKRVETAEGEATKVKGELDDAKRKLLARSTPIIIEPRRFGRVTNECAKYLACVFILGGAAHGKTVNEDVLAWSRKHVESFAESRGESEPNHKDLAAYVKAIKSNPDAVVKTAMTTSDVPLPTGFSREIKEMVEEYGSFRRLANVMPMGEKTVTLPKLTTDPTFNFINASEAIGEKGPQIGTVDFTLKKAGGIVRLPSELMTDSLVDLGQFIARYIARQFANWEDIVGWNADGSATYKLISGVRKRIITNNKIVTMEAGLVTTQQMTLDHFRSMRAIPSEAARANARYFMHGTMEVLLTRFNKLDNGTPYIPNGAGGKATLDGVPIEWINKFPAYGSDSIAGQVASAFGDISWTYLGTGSIRIDTDASVYFGTDEIAIRALERFDVNEMATDHMAGAVAAAS